LWLGVKGNGVGWCLWRRVEVGRFFEYFKSIQRALLALWLLLLIKMNLPLCSWEICGLPWEMLSWGYRSQTSVFMARSERMCSYILSSLALPSHPQALSQREALSENALPLPQNCLLGAKMSRSCSRVAWDTKWLNNSEEADSMKRR
jgi:hypothetical protein